MRLIQIMEHGSKAIPSEVAYQNGSLEETYRVRYTKRSILDHHSRFNAMKTDFELSVSLYRAQQYRFRNHDRSKDSSTSKLRSHEADYKIWTER